MRGKSKQKKIPVPQKSLCKVNNKKSLEEDINKELLFRYMKNFCKSSRKDNKSNTIETKDKTRQLRGDARVNNRCSYPVVISEYHFAKQNWVSRKN